MSPLKVLPALMALGLGLGACAEPGVTVSTGPVAASSSLTFNLTIDDSGHVLRVRQGDEVVPRLPLAGYQDPGWVMSVPPNPAVLGGGDDLRFFPSEADEGGVPYHEFSFIAAGPGRTSFTLAHGLQEFHLTVQVAGDG
jgi:hypothetical protein